MIYDVLFSVIDTSIRNKCLGVTADEYEAWEIVSNFKYDAERLEIHCIDVNRWYFYDAHNCSDKLSDDNVMCYDYEATLNCAKILNKINLQQEREEARKRALCL